LLPVALFARNPLARIVCRAADPIGPDDLAGRRMGVRSYTTTTAVWARALLADEFGVDATRMAWITCEEGHVAGVSDPAHVRRIDGEADLLALLRRGEIDAALVEPVPTAPDLAPVVRDAETVWQRWCARTGALTINHVIVVRESLAGDAARMLALFALFHESRERARTSVDSSCCPIGFQALRRSLEVAIATAAAERLLGRPLNPDLLTTEALRAV
jgi:4,5-dihydroxyphthalate decarboxylase